jgi:DNA-binding transcriptional LysR family regulator
MSSLDLESAPDLELHALRQFLAVATFLHFGRAAEHLGMTQPPLTQAIQKLETRLGVLLFERTRRHVALSPAGSALLEPVRQLLRTAGTLPALARDADSGKRGTLRLGFVSTVGFGPLPAWLRGFHETNPDITIQLREATADVQRSALSNAELDAGFTLHAASARDDVPPGYSCLSVGREPMVFALPTALARRRLVGPAELLSQPLIIFPRPVAPSLHDAILAFFHRHGVVPVIAQEAIQMQTIVNLVSAGLGIALVPRVVTAFRRTGVAYRPPPRSLPQHPRCETRLLWNTHGVPSVLRFVEHVRRQVKEA